jgi:broad specificity phosphatase PhoE
MNLHTVPRPIFLSRHGQSEDNQRELLGGDSPITEKGRVYAAKLAQWFEDQQLGEIQVWTSTLQRTLQTAAAQSTAPIPFKALDEIDAGVCEGMTYAEIKAQMPDAFMARGEDKLRYRYPQGESYEDVIERLEPVLFELERQQEPVLVIAHQAVLRALYAYFANQPRETTPYISIPLHTLIQLTPRAYGCDEERFLLGPEVGHAGSSA